MKARTFSPAWGRGVILATSTTTGNTLVGKGNNVVIVSNQDATDGMYIACGNSSVTATTADYYLQAGASVLVTKNRDDDYVAAIAVANTPSLHIMPGEGI